MLMLESTYREADTNHNKSCPVVLLTIGTSSGVCIFSVFQSLLLTAKVTSVKIDKSKVNSVHGIR